MRQPLARIVATAAVTAGIALGSALATAGPAQAVASIWNCSWVGSGAPGLASGTGCTGSGNRTGAGWLELNSVVQYRCNSFSWSGTNPNAYVGGTGCVVGTH